MTEPELVRRGPSSVVGFVVDARWDELFRAVPEAWRQLFARMDELDQLAGAGRFVEVSLGMKSGVYTELVGIEVSNDVIAPAGMRRVNVSAGNWLHLHHAGDVTGIAKGFGALYDHAEAEGIAVSDVKLDFGYTPSKEDSPHDLYLSLESNAPPRWRQQPVQESEHG